MKAIHWALPVILFMLSGCAPDSGVPQAPEKLRFAVMTFSHETCTFCPGGDSDIERWTKLRPPYVGDDVLNAGSYMRGFVRAAREYDDVELVGLESPAGVYGGSSASWTTEEAFEHFLGIMLEDLREAMPVDGVYLALHGAMAVRNVPRPEAEIARRFREVVGPDVPIVGSFDLHANEDEEFLRWADMAFITKRYPHYDSGLQGERSARALVRIAKGLYSPCEALGISRNRRLRQRRLWLPVVGRSGCRGNDPCHDQQQPGARRADSRRHVGLLLASARRTVR
jgi:microcystin degradation protein MlrC